MREKQQVNAIKHIADKILIELHAGFSSITQKNLIRAQRSEGMGWRAWGNVLVGGEVDGKCGNASVCWYKS